MDNSKHYGIVPYDAIVVHHINDGGKESNLVFKEVKHMDNETKIKEKAFITTYYRDKVAALSLTNDDGTETQWLYTAPTLKKYGFRGTFYISNLFMGDINWEHINEDKRDSQAIRTDVWNDFKFNENIKMYMTPIVDENWHEIGAHTAHHRSLKKVIKKPEWFELTDDLEDNKYLVRKLFPNLKSDMVSFAWPFGASNPVYEKEVRKHFLTGRSISCKVNDPDNMKWSKIYSCDFERMKKEAMKKKKIETIQQGRYLTEFQHSVSSCGILKTCKRGYGNVSPADFEEHLQFLKQNIHLLWVDTVGHITKYLWQRLHSHITSYKELEYGKGIKEIILLVESDYKRRLSKSILYSDRKNPYINLFE